MQIMTNLSLIISHLEKKWLERLFNFVKSLFEGRHLSSHDHFHHLRVWYFTKDLLQQVHSETEVNELFVQELMFASFFHDTGLTRTLDLKHGMESYLILQENIDEFPGVEITSPLKDAIVHHDDKTSKVIHPNDVFSVPLLLATADDLDAFNIIGAYRYAEIYLLRGVPPTNLAGEIQKNLTNRFQNFLNVFDGFHGLISEQQIRYQRTCDVYHQASNEFLKTLDQLITNEKVSIYDLMAMNNHPNHELRTFANNIKAEWDTFDKIINKHEN